MLPVASIVGKMDKKVALQMSYGSFRPSHDLSVLLRPLCTNKSSANKQKKRRQGPILDPVAELLGEEPILMGRTILIISDTEQATLMIMT
jgi:hypothetical protein